jgi:hypothetical protein
VSGFLDPLELEYINGRKWLITSPFEYHLHDVDSYDVVYIPKGYLTDFASIPRILWPLLPPTGSYGKAAVVHDWLYSNRAVTYQLGVERTWNVNRAEADATLFEAMKVLGTGIIVRWLIYLGVRLGGWLPWNNYRQKERKVV